MALTPIQQPSQNPKDLVMPARAPMSADAGAQVSGAVQLPPGMEAQQLLGMAKRMTGQFSEYWKKSYEIRLTDTQRILTGMPAQGSRPGATVIPLAQSILQTSQAR